MQQISYNPYAIVVHCDGAMDYNSKSTGGVGFCIEFPEHIQMEQIQERVGSYDFRNINTLELEAINQAMKTILLLSKNNIVELKKAGTIQIFTDREGITDEKLTNPSRIRDWRHANWENHEGKPIKNAKLLDEIDKNRAKISGALNCRVEIKYGRRKTNKTANKLAKSAKVLPRKQKLENKLPPKVTKRLYSGPEINYGQLKERDELTVRIFRKETLAKMWEAVGEVCVGEFTGKKITMVVDILLEKKLHRSHTYLLKLKKVHSHHVEIFRTVPGVSIKKQ